jgi:hypothetical protein
VRSGSRILGGRAGRARLYSAVDEASVPVACMPGAGAFSSAGSGVEKVSGSAASGVVVTCWSGSRGVEVLASALPPSGAGGAAGPTDSANW